MGTFEHINTQFGTHPQVWFSLSGRVLNLRAFFAATAAPGAGGASRTPGQSGRQHLHRHLFSRACRTPVTRLPHMQRVVRGLPSYSILVGTLLRYASTLLHAAPLWTYISPAYAYKRCSFLNDALHALRSLSWTTTLGAARRGTLGTSGAPRRHSAMFRVLPANYLRCYTHAWLGLHWPQLPFRSRHADDAAGGPAYTSACPAASPSCLLLYPFCSPYLPERSRLKPALWTAARAVVPSNAGWTFLRPHLLDAEVDLANALN